MSEDPTVRGKLPHPAGEENDFPMEWGKYRYVSVLGEGAMGVVYQAFDEELRRNVALKFVRSSDPELLRRQQREASAQARIEHPHVCKVFEVGQVEGRPFIAMQLIDGKTLSQLAATLPLPEKLRLMRQVCDALAAAHAQGIVHRNLKPSNILCERRDDGQLHPYVTDFGLAREARDAHLTTENAVVGTPNFMPPEQARADPSGVDARSDVYSLGATLYAVLAGRPPFEAPSAAQVLTAVLSEPPPPLGRLVPSLPGDVETIVMKCLEKNPARRYGSARALGDELERYLSGEPILARPPSRIYRARLLLRRNKTVSWLAALASVAVLGLGGWLVRTRLEARRLSSLAERFGREAGESSSACGWPRSCPSTT